MSASTRADGFTPTPAVSHAILVANRPKDSWRHLADGIVVTPSHNPPDDGGFKYNPPNGGPADTDVTRWIQDEANRILEPSTDRMGSTASRAPPTTRSTSASGGTTSSVDTSTTWPSVIDMDAIRESGLRIGVDPMGGASVAYWGAIRDRYGLDLTVTNDDRRSDGSGS